MFLLWQADTVVLVRLVLQIFCAVINCLIPPTRFQSPLPRPFGYKTTHSLRSIRVRKMSSLVYLLFVCSITSCFLFTTVVDGARVKIVFHKADLKGYRSRVRRAVAVAGAGETACDDRRLIDLSGLTSPGGPFAGVNERVKFYSSPIADAGFQIFQRLQVPGLNGSNLADVLQVLREENCNGFFIGGAVRDQFLGRTPRDADIDVNCTIGELVEICVRHWGQSNCRGSAGSPVAHIGNTTSPAPDGNEEDIDLGTARVSLFRTPDNLEYTVNALVYDPNEVDTNLILDLPGTGVVDVCNRHIRIPSDDDSEASWDLWRTNRPGYKKLYRAYKLREKAFTYFNNTVLHYITRYSLMGVRSDSEEFSEFICDEAYGGDYDSEANRCTVTPGSDCAGALVDLAKYNAAFADDFGSFWESELLPVAPTSNCGEYNPPNFAT